MVPSENNLELLCEDLKDDYEELKRTTITTTRKQFNEIKQIIQGAELEFN